MSRTRDWIKFGSLVGLTLVLAVAFVSIVDLPERSEAQERTSSVMRDRPAPVEAAQPVVDLGNAFSSVAEVVRPAVVYIDATRSVDQTSQAHPDLPAPFDRFFQEPDEPRQQRGTGSGFIISPDGYIMTNNHVVENGERLDVRLFDGRQFSAEVVGRDADTDIAVIKIDAGDLPAVALGNSDSLRVGEWVLAIGNPLGNAFSFTVTAGIVSGRGRVLPGLQRGRQWSISDFIQTDAAINPGNSGGPLVNIRGQVVGVNSAIASQTGFYSGYSFAVPINLARIVADQLIRDGRVTRAALGVQVQAADDRDAEYVGLGEVRGVVVEGFPSDDSPARQAGIEIGDVIVAVDGEQVDYVAQLQQLVGFKRPGEQTDVTVMRAGGERRTFPVRLTAANPEPEPQVARAGDVGPEEVFLYEGKLGIAVEEMTADMARAAGIPSGEMGLMITDVDGNGPSRDDLFPTNPRQRVIAVITHVNGERVTTRNELEEAIEGVPPGAVASLQLFEILEDTPRSRVVRLRVGG
jgi:serine protease Do